VKTSVGHASKKLKLVFLSIYDLLFPGIPTSHVVFATVSL
jgi:hypothetical protein